MSWLPMCRLLQQRLCDVLSIHRKAGREDRRSRVANGRSKGYPGESGRRSVPLALLSLSLFVSALGSLAICSPVFAAQVTLGWNASADSAVVGYRLYYGTDRYNYSGCVDVGSHTSVTLTGLQDGTYYAAATAYDDQYIESSFSNEVSFTVHSETVEPGLSDSSGSTTPESGGGVDAGGGGGGGGGCFIATAAFGSYMDPHVQILRSFRDVCLLTNAPGRLFVRLYYAASPSIAEAIRTSEVLRAGVRLLLIPAVVLGYFCLAVGLLPSVLLALCLFFVFLFFLGRRFAPESHPTTSL